MVPGREVEVYTDWLNHPADVPRYGAGSGYLLGGRLVVTAAHVACPGMTVDQVDLGAGVVLRVRAPDGPDLLAASVVWRHPDPAIDVALVEVTDPGWVPLVWRRRVRFGRLVTTQARQRCEATGFPKIVATPEFRDSHTADGVLNPKSLGKAERLAVEVTNPPVPPTAAEGSWWAGMSGAAVLIGGMVVGVVTTDPHGFDSRRLVAVPITAATADPAFTALVSAHVGAERGGAMGPVVVEPVELAVAALFERPVSVAPRSPAALLRPEAEVITFQGRAEVLNELMTWCTEGDGGTDAVPAESLDTGLATVSVSMRLVVGPGGQGKTRLAQELAARLRERDWITGRLAAGAPTAAACAALAQTTTAPVLLVVDYADSRLPAILDLLEELVQHGAAVPIRILLLARGAGPWWASLRRSRPWIGDLVASPEPLTLPELHADAASHLTAFAEAVTVFAERLARLPGYTHVQWTNIAAGLSAPPDLDATGGHSALHTAMAALSSLLQSGLDPVAAPQHHVEDILIEHEERYWQAAAHVAGLNLAQATLRRAVVMACLVQPTSRAVAADVARAVPGLRDVPEDRLLAVVDWLGGLFAGTACWGALQPDRLADRLIARVVGDEPELLDEVLPAIPDSQLRSAFTVLGRVWPGAPQVVEALSDAIVAHPAELGPAAVGSVVAVPDPAPMVKAIEQTLAVPGIKPWDVLRMLHAVPERTELLALPALRMAERVLTPMLENLRTNSAALPAAAHSINLAAMRVLHADVDSESARQLSEICVDISTRLVAEHGPEHEHELIRALHLHAASLAQCGQPLDALKQIDRALGFARGPARAADITPEVLSGLTNTRAQILSHLDRPEEALAAFQETLDVIGPAAQSHEHRWMALSVQLGRAMHLARLSRDAEALSQLDEVIPELTTLNATNPDTYRPILRAALVQRALALIGVNRLSEARSAVNQVAALPRSEGPLHRNSLTTLTGALRMRGMLAIAESGYTDTAIRLMREVVDLYRPAADSAGRVDDDQVITFGETLLSHAEFLADAELRGQASAVANEAADVFARLSDESAQTRDRGLAHARVLIARQRRHRSEAAEVAASLDTTIEYLRAAVVAGHAEVTDPLLSGALNTRANRRLISGNVQGALDDMREAVQLRRARAEAEPTVNRRGDLASTLTDYAGVLASTDALEAGLAAAQEAVDIRRALEADEPGKHRRRLAHYVANQVLILNRLGRVHAADALLRALLKQLQPRATEPRTELLEPTAFLMAIRARFLAEQRDFRQAARVATRAIDQYRELAQVRMPVSKIGLCHAKLALGHSLLATRRLEDGTRLLVEQLQIVDALGEPGLIQYMTEIMNGLVKVQVHDPDYFKRFLAQLRELGRHDLAGALVERAVQAEIPTDSGSPSNTVGPPDSD